jgi:hypothetical protein
MQGNVRVIAKKPADGGNISIYLQNFLPILLILLADKHKHFVVSFK